MEASPLSRFELVRPLGRGAMGEVWLARDRVTGATVALKRVLEDALDADGLARFAREAQALGRLAHPGIVGLLAWGVEGRSPWMAMEHVSGGTLHEQVTRQGPLDQADAVRIGAQLARALAHAHAAGVVHRDVKPENLLVARDARVRLVDFGLCRPVDMGGSLTRSGMFMGTPAFAAPELLAGKAREAGPAADAYGLGGVLYFTLTGLPPNRGETLLALANAAHAGVVSPSRLRPDLDPGLEAIVLRCLAVDPGARYVDLRAAASDLEAWLEARAAPPAAPRTARRWLVPLLALGASAALGFALSRRGTEPAAPPVGAQPAPVSAGDLQAAALDRARAAAAGGDFARARDELERVLAEDPDCGSALLGRAQCRLELGDPEGALADAERGTVLQPERASAWEILAEVHRQRGDLERAQQALARALTLEPDSVVARRVGARIDISQGRTEQALASLEQILAARPDDLETRLAYCAFLHVTGRNEEGLREAERCRQQAPQDERPWELLGRITLRLGRDEQALEAVERALSIQPRSSAALRVRAELRLRRGDARGALDDLAEGLRRTPRDATLLGLRGEAFLQLEEYEPARADLEAVLAVRPESGHVRALLAQLELASGDPARAELLLRGTDDPPAVQALLERAQALMARDRRAAALGLLDARDARGDAPVPIVALRADYLLGEERLTEALACAERVLAARPATADVLCTRGMARVGLQDERGLEDIARAAELDPGVGPAFAHAAALVRLRRYPQAMDALRQVIARFPTSSQAEGARRMLALLEEAQRR